MRQWIIVLAAVWFLWGQDEKFWSFRLLNVIPGPTRGNPYIVGEYESRDECSTAQLKVLTDSWKPGGKDYLWRPGGLRSVTWYACVPSSFKPERIDAGGWR